MRVKYSYLSRQFKHPGNLWKNLKNFVKTEDFTLGKPLLDFEKKFAKLNDSKFAVGVNSGTDAIKLSLKVLGVGHGDHVIGSQYICSNSWSNYGNHCNPHIC